MSTRVCVKCGLVNNAAVGTAAEACPRCGAVYTKAQAEAALWKVQQARTAARDSRRYTTLFVAVGVVVAAVIAFAIVDNRSDELKVEQQRVEQERVVREAAAVRTRLTRESSQQDDPEARKARLAERAAFDQAVAALADIEARWKAAVDVAADSPILALAGPMAALQGIRGETAALVPPACMQPAHAKLVESMDLRIDGFAVLVEDGQAEARAKASFDKANDATRDYVVAKQDCDFMNSGDYISQ